MNDRKISSIKIEYENGDWEYTNDIDLFEPYLNLKKENQQLKEYVSFCLKSIKQEMEMSIDSRTKQEMLSCYQILSKWSDK